VPEVNLIRERKGTMMPTKNIPLLQRDTTNYLQQSFDARQRPVAQSLQYDEDEA
jgi:hypothetical protein